MENKKETGVAGKAQGGYSQSYSSIRKAAEGWPSWKKQVFNDGLATAAHSRKVAAPKVKLPEEAKTALALLEEHGKEAYVVGGCVRDSLLGKTPHDWDVCTSATPQETTEIFKKAGFTVIPTGIQHGTVTVLVNGQGIEITTFRMDGTYSDGRHPDTVVFTTSIREDLARRDFTINAMAYSDKTGIVDPFGGKQDLEDKVIRCVGDPMERFREDPLRIMRAIRFASTLRFILDYDTFTSALALKYELHSVAWERKQKELVPLLQGENVRSVLIGYKGILAAVIPEIQPCFGFQQRNPWHVYDVWEHITKAVESASKEDWLLRLILLLHDTGKPLCYTQDENGVGHFHGHGKESEKIAREVLTRLRFPRDVVEKAVKIVAIHDRVIEPTPKAVRRLMNEIGEEQFFMLLRVREADIKAQNPTLVEGRMKKEKLLWEIANNIIASNDCFTLKDLAVSGRDIVAAGTKPGPEVGRKLNALLEKVLEDPSFNTKEKLMELEKAL